MHPVRAPGRRRQPPAVRNFSGKVDHGRSPVFGMFGYLVDIDRVSLVPQHRHVSEWAISSIRVPR